MSAGMNPILAGIYGTDMTKTAADEVAEELADEGGVDMDSLTDEDYEGLAQQALEEGGEGGEEGGDDAEVLEKVSENDFAGRVMAHAYVNELRKIAAAKKGQYMHIGAARAQAFADKAKKEKEVAAFGRKMEGRVAKRGLSVGERFSGLGRRAAMALERHPGKAALLGAAGLGTAAGLGRMSKQKTSALDTLANARVFELLEAGGYDANAIFAETGWGGMNKVSAADALSARVEHEALAKLASIGLGAE